MAKYKNQKQDDEILGQIFDFIFKEAKKPPEKRRPVRVTGLNGNSDLVDALTAALEKPGVFMSDQILDVFNDALDLKLGTFKTDEVSATAKVDFKLSNLAQIIDDPNKAFNDAINKAKEARKLARAQYMGKAVQEFVAQSWARKNNLDLDSMSAIHASYGLRHNEISLPPRVREDEYRKARAMAVVAGGTNMGIFGMASSGGISKGSESAPLIARSGDLIGRKLIGGRRWDNLSEEKKEKILFYFSHEGTIGDKIKKEIPDFQFPADFDSKVKGLRNGVVDEKTGDWNINKGKYIELESANVRRKIANLVEYRSRNRDRMTPQEIVNLNAGIDKLRKVDVLISGQTLDRDKIKNARFVMNKQLSDYKDKLSKALTPEEKRLYKNQIKDLKSNMNGLSMMEIAGFVGQMDGYITSWKNIYGDGNLGMSILNGKFFDSRFNLIFAPGQASKVKLGKDGKESVSILLPAKSPTKNKITDAYNNAMMGFYYLTPKSIAKTLFYNGEGFLYLSSMSGGKAKWAEKAGEIFSLNSRMRDKFTKFIDDKFVKNFRKSVGKTLEKRFTGEAGALLTKWVANGGLQTFGKAIATYIFHAIGITTTGGLGNIVITIVGDKITDATLEAGKILLITLMYVIFGIIAVFILFGNFATSKFYADNFSYTHEAPKEVTACGNYTGISPIIDNERPGGIQPFRGGALPSNVQCLIGSGGFRCSQGPYGSYSHKSTPAVDIPGVQTFYAPQFCGDNNCVVTTAMDVNCSDGYAGGMVIFTATYNSTEYTFKLIHVVQNVSVGQKLSAGSPVADIIQDNELISACSTGPHLHLTVNVNGSSVNPMDVLTKPASEGGFGCEISACP